MQDVYIDTDDILYIDRDSYDYLGAVKMVTTDNERIIVWTADNHFIDVSNGEIRPIDVNIDGVIDFAYDGHFADNLYLLFGDGHLEIRSYPRDGSLRLGQYELIPMDFDELIVRVKKTFNTIWIISYDGAVYEIYKQYGMTNFLKRYDSKDTFAIDVISLPDTLLILTDTREVLIKGNLQLIGRDETIGHFMKVSDLENIVDFAHLYSYDYPILNMLFCVDIDGKLYFSGNMLNGATPLGIDRLTLPKPITITSTDIYPITQLDGNFGFVREVRAIRDKVEIINDNFELWTSKHGQKFVRENVEYVSRLPDKDYQIPTMIKSSRY